MGKAGRFACIITPFALTIASLICIILVGLGGTNKNDQTLDNFYFFKADLTNFTSNTTFHIIPGTNVDNKLLTEGLQQAKQDLHLQDFYAVSLWNYCSGNYTNHQWHYTFCSPRQSEYWFNPVEVWGLNNTGVENLFPKELQDGLKVYQTVSKWMFIAYAVAFFTTITEVVVGVTAIFSRWGSFATTIISSVSTIFILAASITATALYASLAGSFDSVLKLYGIHGSLGHSMFVTTWLAAAFSIGSGFFWLISICCCSGRSPHGHGKDRMNNKRVRVEKTPYTYERVGSPYMGQSSNQQTGVTQGYQQGRDVPMNNLGKDGKMGAYEPFRHEQV